MTEQQIQQFWRSHPYVRRSRAPEENEKALENLFNNADRIRYLQCPQLLRRINTLQLEGRQVLQIGIGDGADAEQLIRRGAIWSGLERSEESLKQITRRLHLRKLPYQSLYRGEPAAMPYESGSFDIVFAHSILSEVHEIEPVQEEIARVLKPRGELISILYAKWSLYYLISRSVNTFRLITSNTSVRVYDARTIRRAFPCFCLESASKMFLYSPFFASLVLRHLPGESMLGWWLWAHLLRRG